MLFTGTDATVTLHKTLDHKYLTAFYKDGTVFEYIFHRQKDDEIAYVTEDLLKNGERQDNPRLLKKLKACVEEERIQDVAWTIQKYQDKVTPENFRVHVYDDSVCVKGLFNTGICFGVDDDALKRVIVDELERQIRECEP